MTVVGILLAGAVMIAFFVLDTLARRGQVSLLDVGQREHKRNTRVLGVLILLSIAYATALRFLGTLTGMTMLDGGIGVAFGLFICAHPAANAVNMLFFERDALSRLSSDWLLIRWLALNLLILLTGWMVIYIGITRLVARVP